MNKVQSNGVMNAGELERKMTGLIESVLRTGNIT